MKIVDLSLAGCLFVVPLLMAGRHPFGQAVLVALALTAAIGWAASQAASRARAPFHPTWLAPILLCGVVVLIIQFVPLPEPLLDRISPAIGQLLPMWHSQTQPAERIGSWRTLSLTPAATRDGLALFSAYALLFFVTVQRAGRIEDIERLLRWCAAAAAVTGIYGLVQLVTSNGKFFWIYEHPFGTTLDAAKGSFTNRNHFAEFLALGTGPLLCWVQAAFGNTGGKKGTTGSGVFLHGGGRAHPRHQAVSAAMEKDSRPLLSGSVKPFILAISLGLVLFAGLLSLSRGGMVAIALALGLTTALCWRAWSGSKGLLAVLAGTVVLVALLLNIFGLDGVNRRIDDFRAGSLEQLDRSKSRRSIWTAAARGIREFSIFGTGVGSHCDVYPIYYSPELYEEPIDREFTHAENSYAQIGLETGIAGLLLLAGAMVCCGFWCVGGLIRARSARVVACLAAVTGSLAAAAVHAVVDFIWYVPACVVMIVILAACAARLWRHSGAQSERVRHAGTTVREVAPSGRMLPRLAYLAVVAVFTPLGAWAVKDQAQSAMAEPAWDAYRKSRAASDKSPEPKDSEGPETSEVRRRAQAAEIHRIGLLRNVLARQPDRARAHLELAQSYLRLFDMIQTESENPMSLGNVRDAALRSRFPSREALDGWLDRAVGEHARYLDFALRHAYRAVSLCPLQGRGYLYLAELCFLGNAGEEWKSACIEQGLRVRPYDGDVLHTAAAEAFLAGRYDRWLELARRSFQCGRHYQQRLIEDLVGRTPQEALEEMIQAIVQTFQPDMVALRILSANARASGRPEQLVWLQRHCAERAEADARSSCGDTAARLWNEARQNYAAIGDAIRAEQCAQRAAASDPQNFEARYGLGLTLLAQRRPAEAEPHLRWCVRRRPNESGIEAKWKEALKGRLDGQPETTARRGDARHKL
jgi:O-antigen ligase/tetratricopeptide (TPR) repeat protein